MLVSFLQSYPVLRIRPKIRFDHPLCNTLILNNIRNILFTIVKMMAYTCYICVRLILIRMKNTCIYVSLLFLFFGCKPSSTYLALRNIESYIQTAPDSALKALEVIRNDDLRREKEQSLFSLLYSIALDKNYVDLCSDSLIKPAVLYYSKHGNNYHRFLSYYYYGRIYENAGYYDGALGEYIKAEGCINSDTPKEYLVRLYSKKSRLYAHQFANDKALTESRRAMAISASLENPAFFLRNSLDVSSLLYQAKRYEESEHVLDSLRQWAQLRGFSLPSAYYKSQIYSSIYDTKHDNEYITALYNSYLSCCEKEHISPNALLSAEVMIRLKRYQDAERYMNAVSLTPTSTYFDSIGYYSTALKAYGGLHDIDMFSQSVQEFLRIEENMYLDVFKRDVRFIEERYANERREEADRRKKTYLVLFIIVLTATLIASTLIYKKRHAQLVREFNEATADYSLLKRIVASADDSKQDIKNALETRILALTPYFQERKTPRLGRDDIKKLKRDNKEMLRNIGLLYSLSFPEYVSALLQYGLSSEEIGLCSLYASGFLSKEVSSIIDSGSIYHINRSIRTKLGDVVDARALPSWLRDLFERCQK